MVFDVAAGQSQPHLSAGAKDSKDCRIKIVTRAMPSPGFRIATRVPAIR